MGNYADPNVDDRIVLVAFEYASDDAQDPAARGEIVEEIDALTTSLGCSRTILDPDALADQIRWAIRGVRAPGYGREFTLDADDETLVRAIVGRLTGPRADQASDPRRRIPRRGRPTPGIHGTRHGRDTK